ncbi:MAG: PqqD family protein [Vulcanimicrobiaceae bacterium]
MPRRIDGLEFQEVGEDVLVHDPNARKIHVLNKSAASVLRACDGARRLDQAAQEIANASDVERARVCADVATILEQFVQLGLVTYVD